MPQETEDRLHQWLQGRLHRYGFDRVGDDGAVLPAGGPWAVTQDHQIEGVHFPVGSDPLGVARRLLAVNLSDLAAMGATPQYAFLALSCPATYDQRRFLSGFMADCERHGVELAGGDLARNDRVTSVLTLIGSRPPGGRWLNRACGRAGDALWIGGELGLSAAGRRLLELGAHVEGRKVHLPSTIDLTTRQSQLAKRAVRRHSLPVPQLDLGRWLGRRKRVAAIDLSDGLAMDLHRLCRASQVGARIHAGALLSQRELIAICHKIDLTPLTTVLAGGEDYSLLFSLPSRVQPPTDIGCRRIGLLTAETDIFLDTGDGLQHLPALGWDHFAHSPSPS